MILTKPIFIDVDLTDPFNYEIIRDIVDLILTRG